jgi:carbamate kinase
MSNGKLAVIAVGGNSLVKSEDKKSLEDQYRVVSETAHHIAGLIEDGWDIAIGHGNGPQLGFTLRRSEIALRTEGIPAFPMDICIAENQAEMGYALQQNLQNEMVLRKIDKQIVTIIAQTLVDKNDPGYSRPSKPVGSFMTEEEALRCRAEFKWDVMDDAGRGWRRVVPSPFPKRILEMETITTLVKSGAVVITAGGGGIPVVDRGDGTHVGIIGAVDKDLAASLMSQQLHADLFVISTAVDRVAINFGRENQTWFDRMTLSEARKYLAEGVHFTRGAMAPKVQSIIWFMENGGKKALITNPENIGNALRGKAGTWFVHDGDETIGI